MMMDVNIQSTEWKLSRLGDICEINPSRPRIERDDNALTTFVPMPAVDAVSGSILHPEKKPFALVKKGYTYFAEGDVIFAKITPCMQNGKHAIAKGLIDGIGFGSTEFHVIRPNESITAEWIHYYLRQSWVLEKAISFFTGAVGQQRVPVNFLRNLEIPLPPLAEQQRIAAILDEQMGHVARARAAAEEQMKAVKQLAAVYLENAFEDEKNKKWPEMRLEEISSLLPAKSITNIGDTEVLAITTACLTETGFNPTGIKKARMWARDARVCNVSPGEILIARSNTAELVGRVAMFPSQSVNVVASDLTIRLFPNEGIASSYLAYYLSALYIQGYWKERASGASGTMKKITRKQIQELTIPVPPKNYQEELAAWIQQKHQMVKELQSKLIDQSLVINNLSNSLLRRAFNGELS